MTEEDAAVSPLVGEKVYELTSNLYSQVLPTSVGLFATLDGAKQAAAKYRSPLGAARDVSLRWEELASGKLSADHADAGLTFTITPREIQA